VRLRLLPLVLLLATGCVPAPEDQPPPGDDDSASDDDDAADDPWDHLTWTPGLVPGEGAIEPVEGYPDPSRVTPLAVHPQRADCVLERRGIGDTIEETYDDRGRVTSRRQGDRTRVWTFEGDRITRFQVRETATGSVLLDARWEYEGGQVVVETFSELGGDAFEAVRTWDGDRLVQRTLDLGRTGTVDRTEVYEYDGDRRTADVMHTDDDGVSDAGRTYRYAQAAVDRPTYQDLDVDGDGTPEMAWGWGWNPDGLWVSYDEGADLKIEERWVWDDRRRLLSHHGPDVDATYTWGVDAESDTMEIDDGDPRTEIHTWEDGLLTVIAVHDGLDGGPLRSSETRTHEDGRITSRSLDHDGDGAPDELETWVWTCD